MSPVMAYVGRKTHLLLGQVVGEVGDHDLGLGRNTVSRGAALAALTGRAVVGLAGLVVAVVSLVGDVLQSLGSRGSGALGTLLLLLALGRDVSFSIHFTDGDVMGNLHDRHERVRHGHDRRGRGHEWTGGGECLHGPHRWHPRPSR